MKLQKLKKDKILVVAAHPDDEVLGCGATLLKYQKKGAVIEALFIADGVSSRETKINKKHFLNELKNRRADCLRSNKKIGIKKSIFLNFKDNQLDSYPILKIIKKIEKKIKLFKPTIIFTHFYNDLNVDHQIVNKATVTACRPQGAKTFPKKLFFFEIPSSTEWQIKRNKELFNPNWFEDVTKTINYKIRALKEYKKEIRNWPHPRSERGVKALAEWRGATSGDEAAEAFILARKV